MTNTERKCVSCDQAMYPIRLVDATSIGSDHTGMEHVDLGYAAVDEQAMWMTGRVPTLGSVYGAICPSCGAIQLYGLARGAFPTGARDPDKPPKLDTEPEPEK